MLITLLKPSEYALAADILLISGATIGIAAYAISKDVQEEKQLSKIEENIKGQIGFDNFSANAIYVADDSANKYVEIFGEATEHKGQSPQLSSVTFEIDDELYNQIINNLRLIHTQDSNGNENVKNYHEHFFSNEYVKILKQLVEISEGKIVEFKSIASSAPLSGSIQENGFNPYKVSKIGNVVINAQTGLAHFTIDFVDINQTDSSINQKKILVSQIATKEIVENPFLACENFALNSESCDVQLIEEDSTILHKAIKNGSYYSFVLDGDPIGPQKY